MANRYSQISTSTFDPMSFQEQLFLPQYMREQHDAQNTAMASIDSEIAKAEALDIHSDVASTEQKRLYDQIAAQRDKLASEGFNQSNKNELLRLNKEYQQSVSSTGILGKANQAKAQFQVEKDKYITNASKMGYSPEAAANNWDKHSSEYRNNFNGKDISDINSLNAPEYINAVEKATELFKSAGLSTSDITGLTSSGIVKNDPNNPGTYVLTTKGSRTMSGTNATQLQAALDYINNQVLNPNSTTHQSIIHQGKNPNDILNEVAGLANVYKKSKYAYNAGARTISGYNPLEKQNPGFTGGLTATDKIQVVPSYSKMDYSKLSSEIESLKSNSNLQGQDGLKLSNLIKYKKRLDERLMNNDEASQLLKEIEDRKKQKTEYEANLKDKGDSIWSERWNDGVTSSQFEIKEQQDRLEEIRSDFAEEIQLTSTNYAILPTTSKERTSHNVMNESLGSTFVNSPSALTQNFKIKSIVQLGDDKKITDDDDIQGIQSIVFNADPKDFEFVGVTSKGIDGESAYRFKINTKKGNSYDLNGIGENGGDIGDGEPVTIDVSPKNFNSDVVKNLDGYIKNYISNNGGEKGSQLVNSMNINSVISKYRGQNWKDLVTNPSTISRDPELKQIFKYKVEALMSNKRNSISKDEAINKVLNERFYD